MNYRPRSFVLSLFLLAVAGACIFSLLTRVVYAQKNTRPQIRLNNYADLFLRGTYDVLHTFRVREVEKIGQACKIATQRKLAGGKIMSHIGTPHIMYAGACAPDVPGNPNIAPDPFNANRLYDRLDSLSAGDFLITANPDPKVKAARERGCYVLGIAFPMTTNRYSPPQYNDFPDTPIETQVDIMIYDWAPKEDGLITPKLTPMPHLKILPTSPITVVEYWSIMAQLAHNLANNDLSGSGETAAAYLDTLMGRLDVFHERNIQAVNVAGERMAEKILAGGKMIPWSTRREFLSEASGTAGGLMGIYPLKAESLTKNDVVILAAAGATPEQEIEMARQVRAKGALLIGIFPFKREDGISTEPLKKLCDLSFDNLSGDIYGIFRVKGYKDKIIPTTGLMNNYIYWALTGAYVQAMESRGVAPYYWMSLHVPGGKAFDDSVRVLYQKRGY
ncbi:MAG: DUF2529 family protein [Candidatus Latescibacterota bacterium]